MIELRGMRLGSCDLLQRIGGGGMGEVYLAQQSALGRHVAVKVIRDMQGVLTDDAARERAARLFTREARAIAALDHPNILPLFEFGEQAGIHYLVMPYMPAGSLARLVGTAGRLRLPLEPAIAAEFVFQIATALQFAHGHGIVHRDIKPQNVLIRMLESGERGIADPSSTKSEDAQTFASTVQLLLADFGLAILETNDTESSAFRGTPQYSAPEQCRGVPVSASDQYALACVAYLLLTGQHVFRGTVAELYHQHLAITPFPASYINPALPPGVDAVLLRGLDKDPERRFPQAIEFGQTLKAELDETPPLAWMKLPDDSLDHSPTRVSDSTKDTQRFPSGPSAPTEPNPRPLADGKLTRRRMLAGAGIAAAALLSAGVYREVANGQSNAARPRLRWRFETGSRITGQPVIANNALYVTSLDTFLYAIDARDGHFLWSAQTGDAIFGAPALAGGAVFVGSDDRNVYAFDAATGARLWRTETGGWIRGSPAIAGEQVFVGAEDGSVYALNALSGTITRHYKITGSAIHSTLAVAGSVVYFGADDHIVYALDTSTGHVIWRHVTGSYIDSSPVLVDGIVYIGSSDQTLYALDATTGAVRGTYATGGPITGTPAIVRGVAYIGSHDAGVYAFDLGTGKMRWRTSVNGAIWASPSVVNDVVYFGAWDGYVYAVTATTGAALWRYQTGATVTCTPAVAGAVYIGSDDHTLYALNS